MLLGKRSLLFVVMPPCVVRFPFCRNIVRIPGSDLGTPFRAGIAKALGERLSSDGLAPDVMAQARWRRVGGWGLSCV